MMYKSIRCSAALIMFAATGPLCAQNAAPVLDVVSAPGDVAPPVLTPVPVDAQTLAGLLVPRQLFIDVNMVNFEKGMTIMAQQSPELGELFRQYPGLDKAMMQSGGTELRKILDAEYPELSNRIALFVAERYLPADLVALNRFYSGSAGRKLIEAEYGSANAEDMVKAFSDADGKLTTDEVKAMETKAASTFGSELTRAEKTEASRFFLGASGRKIGQNKNDFQKLTVDWVNQIIAKHQDSLAATSTETIMNFIQQSAVVPPQAPATQ